jgi:hypothetical protein
LFGSQARRTQDNWCQVSAQNQGQTGRFKGQIVSLECMQIPGVDCTQSFSPVRNDTSVRIVIGLTLFNDSWTVEVVNVEAAFLEGGDMERTMHIEWPAGMVQMGFVTEEEKEECCIRVITSVLIICINC